MAVWDDIQPDRDGLVTVRRGRQDYRYGYCWCGCGERTTIAPQAVAKQEIAKGEPYRFRVGHQKRYAVALSWRIEDRGYRTPCWIWQGEVNGGGYGRTAFFGRRDFAHRVMLQHALGIVIPAGMHTDHLCEVRRCVNPDHLEVVQPHVNARRGRRGRLTEAEYEAFESRAHDVSAWEFDALAEEFGLTPTSAYSLILRAKQRAARAQAKELIH